MPSEQPAKADMPDSVSAVDTEFNKIDSALERLEMSIELLGKRIAPVRSEPVPENPSPPLLEDISGSSRTTRKLGEIHSRIEQYNGRIGYITGELEI